MDIENFSNSANFAFLIRRTLAKSFKKCAELNREYNEPISRPLLCQEREFFSGQSSPLFGKALSHFLNFVKMTECNFFFLFYFCRYCSMINSFVLLFYCSIVLWATPILRHFQFSKKQSEFTFFLRILFTPPQWLIGGPCRAVHG